MAWHTTTQDENTLTESYFKIEVHSRGDLERKTSCEAATRPTTHEKKNNEVFKFEFILRISQTKHILKALHVIKNSTRYVIYVTVICNADF